MLSPTNDWSTRPDEVISVDDRYLSRDRLVDMTLDRITYGHRRALLALDPNGRVTTVERRLQRHLQDLRRLRLGRNLIAEIVLSSSGNRRWFATDLGRVVRERLERETS